LLRTGLGDEAAENKIRHLVWVAGKKGNFLRWHYPDQVQRVGN
jgi:hypothetical protein